MLMNRIRSNTITHFHKEPRNIFEERANVELYLVSREFIIRLLAKKWGCRDVTCSGWRTWPRDEGKVVWKFDLFRHGFPLQCSLIFQLARSG